MAPPLNVSLPVRCALVALRFYQLALSPLLGGECRFHPSCSEYSRQAFLAHGFCKGMAFTLWRLLRCQPLCKGGEDPVPQAVSR